MTISIGALRQRLTLEAPAETVASGEVANLWTNQGVVWAEMVGLTGLNRSGLTAEAEWRFRIRYRADMTPRWRLRLGRQTFGIISAVDPDGLGRELVILAREIIP